MATKIKKRTVVIVGGGLTAGLISRELVSKGVDVLVLERGGDHRDGAEGRLPTQRDDLRWDTRQGLIQDWAIETYTLRHAPDEESLPIRRMEAFLPGEGLGGAGNHWNGVTYRWAEQDFVLRSHLESRYGKGCIPTTIPIQDWGISYSELEPYYDLFEKLFGISGKAGNIRGQIQEGGNLFEAPRQNEYPQAPLERTEAGQIFVDTVAKLGHKAFPRPAANSSGPYTNPDGQQLGQCQYCGHCERFICEAKAKATPQQLLYPLLTGKTNFETRVLCHVLGLLYEPKSKRVTGVRYLDLSTGMECEQEADIVVLCSFTLSNTKLLLASGIGAQYNPKTNEGVVGKNLCYQSGSAVDLFFKDRWINPFMASGCTGMAIDDFNNDNFDHTGLNFFGGGELNATVTSGRPIRGRRLPPGTPRWGTEWKEASAMWYAHTFQISSQGSCYPHRENFLDLDPTYKDAYGQALLRMTFDWRENEIKMVEHIAQKMKGLAEASGATMIGTPRLRLKPFDTRFGQSSHIAGGTIMGINPQTSVVSTRLQHWDAQNLFVAGASVFPHNSGYNPTGTAGALALRLGSDLIRYIKQPQWLQ